MRTVWCGGFLNLWFVRSPVLVVLQFSRFHDEVLENYALIEIPSVILQFEGRKHGAELFAF
jgi:hypothetical protein